MHTEGLSQSYFFLFHVLRFLSWYQNNCEKWKSRWKWNVYQTSTYHSINWKQLVPSFEPSMPFCHSSRNDARNINRWILFLSSHHIKAQAFISLWQLHHSRVWMAFTCSKSSNCCLEEKKSHLAMQREHLYTLLIILQEELSPVKTFKYLILPFFWLSESTLQKLSSMPMLLK